MQVRGLTAAGVIALAAACGGTAVIDPPDDDGAGGSATGTSTGTSTGVSSLEQPCEQACDRLLSCATLSENCKKGCNAPAGSCDAAQIAMMECYGQELQQACAAPSFDCNELLSDFLACRDATIAEVVCETPSPTQCLCAVLHESSDVYESECSDDLCDCFANGDYVGTCLQDPQTTSSCDPLQSCCSAAVYIAAPP